MRFDTEQSLVAVCDISSRHGVDNGLNSPVLTIPWELRFKGGWIFGSEEYFPPVGY